MAETQESVEVKLAVLTTEVRNLSTLVVREVAEAKQNTIRVVGEVKQDVADIKTTLNNGLRLKVHDLEAWVAQKRGEEENKTGWRKVLTGPLLNMIAGAALFWLGLLLK